MEGFERKIDIELFSGLFWWLRVILRPFPKKGWAPML